MRSGIGRRGGRADRSGDHRKLECEQTEVLTFTTGNTTEATLTIANTGTAAFYLDDVGVQKEISMIGELSSPITLKEPMRAVRYSLRNWKRDMLIIILTAGKRTRACRPEISRQKSRRSTAVN